ncbi:MAG: glycogen synthase GlgA [Oscillospiraceae bacterium]|jgi:starch synthase
MKVLFVTSEAAPFAVSGGLGDVSSALPKALNASGIDTRVVMPLYSDIKSEYRLKMKYICNFNVPLSWRNQYCGIFKLVHEGVTFYFIDNEYYFKRSGLYGYYDDAERFAFYSKAVLEMLQHIDFTPDIIHSNDWESALVNVYINAFYRQNPKYSGIKTLFTIHNIQYQGKYGMELLDDVLGMPKSMSGVMEYQGCANFMKAAIVSSDKVTTVSPTYAREITDSWYAYGLDPIIRSCQYKTCGILNGIDTELYNPETDKSLAANFSASNLSGKKKCREEVIERFGLEKNAGPVISLVTRMVAQKGLDLVKYILDYMMTCGLYVVMLGSGDYSYEETFKYFAGKYPGRFGLELAFDPVLARKIYAGSDMFLMPSKFEPCGLSQMIAMRYGTVPIVRETGGLKDTITDSGDGKGNGFTFKSYNAHDMLGACLRAKAVYEDPKRWEVLMKRDMAYDSSWKRAAVSYTGLYNEMLNLW